MGMRRVVFNGRCFSQPLTGVQRYGLETLVALDRWLGREPRHLARTAWQLALPLDARDLPLLDHFEFSVLPFGRGHAWEQLSLAGFARGAYLVNPSYSAPLFKRRQLITAHDAGPKAHPATYTRRYRAWNGLVMGWLAPRVDTLMTVSNFSARELRRHYHLSRDDLVVGVSGWEHLVRDEDPAARDAVDADVLRRHGLQPGGYLLAVGSPKANKNFGLLPRALALLEGQAVPPLVIVGAADSALYRGVAAAPAGTTRALGAVTDIELRALYRHAAWFVFPSVYEGFGLPALEAMALGCPVLAARAASIPEVCGDAALYFDPHDPAALAALLRRACAPGFAAERAVLVAQGRRRLALYRWELNARILLDRLVAVGAVADPEADGVAFDELGLAEPSTAAVLAARHREGPGT